MVFLFVYLQFQETLVDIRAAIGILIHVPKLEFSNTIYCAGKHGHLAINVPTRYKHLRQKGHCGFRALCLASILVASPRVQELITVLCVLRLLGILSQLLKKAILVSQYKDCCCGPALFCTRTLRAGIAFSHQGF
jgi:hypothetical protein